MSAELDPRLQTYDQVKRGRKEAFTKRHDTPWAVVDFVFWQSAIFSRQAMRLNHVQAHRYGDRKALGMFRIIATFIMLTLLAFSTVYDLLINLARPWLSLNFWVCLGTFIYFLLTLIDYQHYFSAKQPDPKKAADGSNPFYTWKLISVAFSFAFQASIHLVFYENLTRKVEYEADLFLDFVSYAPLVLLLCDFFANRIYLPIPIAAFYAYFCYAIALLAILIVSEIEEVFKLPELQYFYVDNMVLAWWLPAAISLGTYLAMRIKFWYFEEGDLTFDLRQWAKNAQDRMQWMETDGVREEMLTFSVENDEEKLNIDPHNEKEMKKYRERKENSAWEKVRLLEEDEIDYTNPEEVRKQSARRKEHANRQSVRHKRMADEFRRDILYNELRADKKYTDVFANGYTSKT